MGNPFLPVLPSNFAHASLTRVTGGPRRELTLTLIPLVWGGGTGQSGQAVLVRVGGIVSMAEVEALCAQNHQEHSELAWLRYDPCYKPKPGHLSLRLEFERADAGVTIQCSNISVTEAVEPDA